MKQRLFIGVSELLAITVAGEMETKRERESLTLPTSNPSEVSRYLSKVNSHMFFSTRKMADVGGRESLIESCSGGRVLFGNRMGIIFVPKTNCSDGNNRRESCRRDRIRETERGTFIPSRESDVIDGKDRRVAKKERCGNIY